VTLDQLHHIFLYDADKGGSDGGSDEGSNNKSTDEKEKAETKPVPEELDRPTSERARPQKDKVEPKTFTQEELDHLFAQRTKNVREKTLTELLTSLGVGSLDEIKAFVSKQKEIEEAAKSDLQKAQEEAKEARLAAEQAKAEQTKVMAAAREALMKADVLRYTIGFKDASGTVFRPEAVEDVWLVLDKSSITDGEEGTFKGVKEAVEKVAKDRPHWLVDVKQATKPRGTPDAANGQKQISEDKKTSSTSRRPFTL
jgi:hypothetical protein